MTSPDPLLRAKCIQALGTIDPDGNLDIFSAALEDKNPETRAQAAWLAARTPSLREQGISAIQAMLVSDNNDMKCWGAYAAGKTKSRALFYNLAPLISSPHFSVRLKAMEAMETMIDFSDRDYRSLFFQALQDKTAIIRLQA